MLLVGYCYGIRSERRLCEEVHLNLAYRGFCRLGLDGEVPDHSTFSKNRHGRFRDCDLLRKLFETVVRRCMAEGLVEGAAFAVDASLIAADANKQRSAARSDEVDWEAIARTRRSVREYLDTLDEAAWGAASETVPKFISKSDPAAQWTGAHKGHAFFAYADNYLIDLKAAIIIDVEATRAIRQAEVGAARTMIERTEDRLGLCPERLAADSAYGAAEMLGWLVNERAIEPHIPVFDKSARDDGTFSRGDFDYNQEADIYVCPAGKVLTSTGTLVNDGATLLYRASKHDCDACELKPRCCPKMPACQLAFKYCRPNDTQDVFRCFLHLDLLSIASHESEYRALAVTPHAADQRYIDVCPVSNLVHSIQKRMAVLLLRVHKNLRRAIEQRYGRARSSRAAATMFTSEGRTSSHLRVFRPQSGLIQSCASESRSLASLSRSVISPISGTRGEWMS
jgi:IS5 family transposase